MSRRSRALTLAEVLNENRANRTIQNIRVVDVDRYIQVLQTLHILGNCDRVFAVFVGRIAEFASRLLEWHDHPLIAQPEIHIDFGLIERPSRSGNGA